MKTKCLIRHSDTYSIPGGWTLTHPALGGLITAGRSPEDAVATLMAHLRVNGMAATEDECWAYANASWGAVVLASGQAERWAGPPMEKVRQGNAPPLGPHLRRILSPKDTGPVLWGTLHLLPLIWDKAGWMGFITLMTKLIEPGGYESGCRDCAAHWKAFRTAHPPELVETAAQAADWSLRAHNGASGYANHRQWSWREAATKWGWPAEWEPK
jgi:hypothetical protein